MKDICTISVVTFHPVWGDKASNLRRIEEYIECAYRKGSQIVIFPEMSLTGYDDEADKPFKEKCSTSWRKRCRVQVRWR